MIMCFINLSFTSLLAQDFKVKEFSYRPNDLLARTHERLDLNDVPCAVIRFVAPDIMSYTFDGNIVGGIEYSPGEAVIYLTESTRSLVIKNNKFGVLRYTFPMAINRQCVYELQMDVPNRVIVPAGTVIRLKSLQEVMGRKAKVGDIVEFSVMSDVMFDNHVVFKKGTIAKGTVLKAKRSKWFGTRGYLTINVDSLCLPENRSVELTDATLEFRGISRGWTAIFVVYTFWISGTKAVMPKNYTFKALLGDNIPIDY